MDLTPFFFKVSIVSLTVFKVKSVQCSFKPYAYITRLVSLSLPACQCPFGPDSLL